MNKSIGVIGELALTLKQVRLMYNLEFYKTSFDIERESNIEKRALKKEWQQKWVKGIEDIYSEKVKEEYLRRMFMGKDELKKSIEEEFRINKNNKMWYYLIILEAELFIPYFPLDTDKVENKKLGKLKFANNEYIDGSVRKAGFISADFVKRIEKTYTKSLGRIKGTKSKVLIAILAVLAIAGVAFGMAAIFAPQIALLLVGAGFPALKGMALINASLAFIGGGALAIGGLGVAGGTMIIAGGGALLGLGISGSVAGGITMMLLKNPEFALTQIAKLEVTMKEIILNGQHDIRFAQEVLKEYKKQIRDCEDLIEKLENSDKRSKKEIKDIKKTIKYMKKAYDDMNKFKSCFDLDSKDKDKDKDKDKE